MTEPTTTALVREILTSTESVYAIAKRLGLRPNRVRRIALGINHRDILPELPRRQPGCTRVLSNEQVYAILTSELNNMTLAKQFGVSVEAVSQVRRGRTFKNLFPELPRTGASHLTSGNRRRLNPEDRHDILTSNEPARVLAARYNRSIYCIYEIRRLARRQRPAADAIHCSNCQHYEHSRLQCGMGFPDAVDPTFASDCSLFTP